MRTQTLRAVRLLAQGHSANWKWTPVCRVRSLHIWPDTQVTSGMLTTRYPLGSSRISFKKSSEELGSTLRTMSCGHKVDDRHVGPSSALYWDAIFTHSGKISISSPPCPGGAVYTHMEGKGRWCKIALLLANEGVPIFREPKTALGGKQNSDKGKSITMASLPGDSCSLDTRLRFMATAFTLC